MKLPFSFSLKLVFRLLLPGFLVALGAWPFTRAVGSVLGLGVSQEVYFGVSVLVLGWAFVLLDMPIYMLLEGRRFWPASLLESFEAKEQRRLKRLLEITGDSSNAGEREVREASVELRQFPLLPGKGYSVVHPTRLGNLIASFELYPLRAYGMDSIFYFPRIWLGLDKDQRQEIDDQQALADSAVYACVALSVDVVLLVLIAAMRWIPNGPAEGSPDSASMLLLATACAIGARAAYRVGLHAQASYGELFKAVFDRFRRDVDADIDEVLADVKRLHPEAVPDDLSRSARSFIAWRYLHNGRIKTPSGDLVYAWEAPGYRVPGQEPAGRNGR